MSRIAYSDADIAGRVYVKSLVEAAGLDVRIDAAGNLIGRREGTDRKLPTIVVGSHTDSVPHGGIYDGDVGVIGGIEVAQQLRDSHVRLRHALEVVDFTDEEGGLVGSRAMAGDLTAATLDLVNGSFGVGGCAPLGKAPFQSAGFRASPGDSTKMPTVAAVAPQNPATRKPTNIAVITPGPGLIMPMATAIRNVMIQ